MESFDFKSVVELLMGDEDVAKDILKGFILQTDKHLQLLEVLLNDENFETKREEIKSKAHLLKGSALNVSAKDFSHFLLEMEKTALSAKKEDLLDIYVLICEKWKTLREEIENIIY